jgi:hypothetical protein
VRIPASPLFCASGFGQFEGAQIYGPVPFEITRGGHRAIETVYGATVALNVNLDPAQAPDPDPANAATVHFLDQTCMAGPGNEVQRTSFDAGTVAIDVQQWVGHPIVIMSGLRYGQGIWAGWGSSDSCPT